MERSTWWILLGLSLMLLFAVAQDDQGLIIAANTRPTPVPDGFSATRGSFMERANTELDASPCDSPTQRIELRSDLDLQTVIDEAPPGSVLELQPVPGQRYRIPEQGLVITKDLALCGSDLFRVELEGPVVPNPPLAREILGQDDGWGSAMAWIAAQEPISVWVENLAFIKGVPEDNPQPRPPNTYGIVMAKKAFVTLRNVLLKEHRYGLGVRDEAQATLEDVGILQEKVGIVIRNRARVELLRVRIADNLYGINASGDFIEVRIRGSWVMDNGTGLYAHVVSFPRTVQMVVEKTSLVGNEVGVRMDGAQLAPADERTRNWFPTDITLRQSRILSNGIGVIIDRWARVTLEDSEVAYNRSDGVNIDAGIPPADDTGRFWRGGSLVLRGSRVHENGGYGVVLFVAECGGSRPLEDAFLGNLAIRDSEIFDNRLGDLCPEDFPWSEGSTNP